MKKQNIPSCLAAAAVTLGAAGLVPAMAYASTYDTATKTVTANNVTVTDGSAYDGENFYSAFGIGADYAYALHDDDEIAAFLSDFSSPEGLTITGTASDVEQAITAMYAGLLAQADGQTPEGVDFAAALQNVSGITVDYDGDVTLTPNHLGYLYALQDLANGVADGCSLAEISSGDCASMTYTKQAPTVPVTITATGSITMSEATADYAGTTLAEIADGSDVTVSGDITIPDGYTADTIMDYFGDITVKAGSEVTSDGETYAATADNTFAAETGDEEDDTVGLPETGGALTNSSWIVADNAAVILSVLTLAVISSAFVLANRKKAVKRL
jgi:hypothetical protein